MTVGEAIALPLLLLAIALMRAIWKWTDKEFGED